MASPQRSHAASPAPGGTPARGPGRLRAGTEWQQALVFGLVVLVVMILVVPPVAMLLYGSFRTADPGLPSPFSLQPVANLLKPEFRKAIVNTLVLGLFGSLLAVVNGAGLAFLLARTDTPGRNFLGGLVSTSFYIPTFLSAAGWFLLGSPVAGILNQAARWVWPGFPGINVLSMGGMIWVMGLAYTPYVFMILRAPLMTMDPSLEEAARASGAGPIRTVLRITAPLLTYSLISSFLVTFVQSLGNFGIPGVLGFPANKPVLATEIWSLIQFYPADFNTAAAMSFVLMAIASISVWVQRSVVTRREQTTITGKGYRPRTLPLGRWRWLSALVCWGYVTAAVLLPMAVLVYSSLLPVWSFDRSSLAKVSLGNYYKLIFEHPTVGLAFKNSTMLSLGGATFGILLATLVSYFTLRSRMRGASALETVATLPVAMPGLSIGLGLLWAYISLPIGIYGTIWILLISYVTHYLPHAVRAVSANMVQLDDSLEESARVSGASWLRTFLRVIVPLVRPGMISGWLILVVTFYRELSSAMLLATSNNTVVSVLIYGLYANAEWGLLSALAVLVLILIFAIYGLAMLFGRQSTGAI